MRRYNKKTKEFEEHTEEPTDEEIRTEIEKQIGKVPMTFTADYIIFDDATKQPTTAEETTIKTNLSK